MFIYFNDVE